MNQFPERNPKLAWREIDGEAVIISPEDSHVHELNETASLIWKRADGRHNVDEIAAAVSEEYEVSVTVATTDVRELISTLEQKGLLSIRKPDEVLTRA